MDQRSEKEMHTEVVQVDTCITKMGSTTESLFTRASQATTTFTFVQSFLDVLKVDFFLR